jgi:predicted transcriptional regulator
LAKEIKAKREELKLTQRELAQLANISQREISFLEQAKGNQTLASVSRVLFILDLQLEIRK